MDNNKKVKLYEKMLELRFFDEMCMELKLQDLVMDGFHPYSGEEACAVGACDVLDKDDAVTSTHRPQGHSLAKGSTAKELFCEMLGRRGGVSQGLGGPMQWVDHKNRFYCGSIVGSGTVQANGIAFAMRHFKMNNIVISFLGDGASNTGAFHEAMNMAAIWKLPVIFFIENNQYAEAMPVREFVSAYPISNRAKAYNMEGVTIDGNNVLEVRDTVGKFASLCREGKGPFLIEAITYRFGAHYGGDPQHTYRSHEEIDAWREKDPLKVMKQHLISECGLSESELDSVADKVKAELEKAKTWALEQPFPTVEQATSHVFVDF